MTTTKHALLLCVMLLSATLVAASPSAQQRNETLETIENDALLSAAVSGCGLCQRTGQCDQAFRGGPGQFCQTLVSGAPCCCPSDAQCVLDNAYNCRCRRTVVSTSPNVRSVTHTSSSSSGPSSSMIFFLLLLICCVCCCCGASKDQRRNRRAEYAQPVYATQYGTTDAYAYPSAPPMYEERGGNNTSGYAAGAVGAVAGLATGAYLGSAFSGHGGSNQTTTTSYFAGDSGDGVSGSTFDFAGDTGGGGDDDFAGDS